MGLSDKKLAFCYEYVVDFDRQNAMSRIGYDGKHPSVQAHKWLEDPEVKAKVNELKVARIEQLNLSAYDVLKELKTIVNSDVKDFVNEQNEVVSIKNLPSHKTRAISSISVTKRYNMFGEEEITTKLSFWDKNAALEKLGKHFGIFEIDNSQRRPVIAVQINDR